jgi:hypothetical protein
MVWQILLVEMAFFYKIRLYTGYLSLHVLTSFHVYSSATGIPTSLYSSVHVLGGYG